MKLSKCNERTIFGAWTIVRVQRNENGKLQTVSCLRMIGPSVIVFILLVLPVAIYSLARKSEHETEAVVLLDAFTFPSHL